MRPVSIGECLEFFIGGTVIFNHHGAESFTAGFVAFWAIGVSPPTSVGNIPLHSVYSDPPLGLKEPQARAHCSQQTSQPLTTSRAYQNLILAKDNCQTLRRFEMISPRLTPRPLRFQSPTAGERDWAA